MDAFLFLSLHNLLLEIIFGHSSHLVQSPFLYTHTPSSCASDLSPGRKSLKCDGSKVIKSYGPETHDRVLITSDGCLM